jgi:methionyl-tRNA formyltransferase
MRSVFLGTPDFAVPSLRALALDHEVVAVFTQPNRPKGRGQEIAESPVKIEAEKLRIPLHQPERIRRPESIELIRQLQPELMVVVGYGQIIPQSIIDIPPRGILNVHASLLPKYRGAAPIQWAIASGERETGVTIMQIDAGLDTGDMLLKASTAIADHETAPELSQRLAHLGAGLLVQAIAELESARLVPEKQDDADATLAPILKKEDGQIDWSRSAQQVYDRFRGFQPWPGAYTNFRGRQLNITAMRLAQQSAGDPASLMIDKRKLAVHCGSGTAIEVLEVQMAGKKRTSVEAFLNGYKPVPGEKFGDLS